MVKDRLEPELSATSRLRVLPTERPDALGGPGPGRAAARGARRDDAPRGLRADRRQAAGRDPRDRRQAARADGAAVIDVPEEYLGVVTQLLALRKGRLEQMVNHGTGWARLEYLVPARGLIGFRTEFLTETRGTGLLHHVFDGYEPWHGELRTAPHRQPRRRPARRHDRHTRSLNLQERGALFLGPGGGLRGDDHRRERARRRTWTSTRPRRRSSPTCARRPPRSWCAWSRPPALARAGPRVRRATTSASR